MKRFCLYLSILAVILMLTGCGTTGIIYTHVTTPFDTNMDKTPVAGKEGSGDIKELTLNYASFLWGSNAIGDIAKENGFKTVHYADIEKLQVLGVWSQYTVHIYGK